MSLGRSKIIQIPKRDFAIFGFFVGKELIVSIKQKSSSGIPCILHDECYRILHAPTGLFFPFHFPHLSDAESVAKKLVEGYSWNFTDPEDVPPGVANFFRKLVIKSYGKETASEYWDSSIITNIDGTI